jgi:hypothetical protein
MKSVLKTALLLMAISTIAAADSFTFDSIPASALQTPSTKYLKSSSGLGTFSSAASFSREGYIGTVYLQDSFTFSLDNNGPTQVAVPEPASLVLLSSGLALAGLRRRRLRSRQTA